MTEPQWLDWARRLQAIAQNGLTFSRDPYDTERYHQIRQIAAEIMAGHSSVPVEQVLKLFESEDGYATPKVDCRGFAVRDNKVLLVRERMDGRWTLPGGWIDVGESPREAVEREVREESGYSVKAAKLAMVYDRDKHGHPPLAYSIYKLFFICEISGSILSSVEGRSREPANIEIYEVGFFAEDDLPELSPSRINAEEINRCFEHYRSPEMPTEFD